MGRKCEWRDTSPHLGWDVFRLHPNLRYHMSRVKKHLHEMNLEILIGSQGSLYWLFVRPIFIFRWDVIPYIKQATRVNWTLLICFHHIKIDNLDTHLFPSMVYIVFKARTKHNCEGSDEQNLWNISSRFKWHLEHTHTHTHTIAISDRFRNRTTIIYSKWVCGLPCLSQGLASSSWSTAFKKEYSSDRPIGINRPILAGKYSKDTSIRQQFGTTESRAKGRCWAFQYVQSFYLLGGTRKDGAISQWSETLICISCVYLISLIHQSWKPTCFSSGLPVYHIGLPCLPVFAFLLGYCSWTESCYLGWLFCDTTITIPTIHSVLRHVPTAG